MLSIVICGRNATISEELKSNIQETIGIPHEIIWIDNSTKRYSICAAYNKGAAESHYDLLCFMHDDIIFHSQDWGKAVVDALQEEKVGIVGIAGSRVKTKCPSPWWISNLKRSENFERFHLLQYRGQFNATVLETANPAGERYAQVLIVDGVWMCCRKSAWEQNKFDENNIKGFHFYDQDFSLTMHTAGLRNLVTYNILLEHRSAGQLENTWLTLSWPFYMKWKKFLPLSIDPISKKEFNTLEFEALRNYLYTARFNKFQHRKRRFAIWCWSLLVKAPGVEHLRMLKSVFS